VQTEHALHGMDEGGLHGTYLSGLGLPERPSVQAARSHKAKAHGTDGREVRRSRWMDEASDEVAVSADALDGRQALRLPVELAVVGDS